MMGRGDGYTLPRSAIDSISTAASLRELDIREKGCLMKAIGDIQSQHQGQDQDRQFLLLARRWNVSLTQLQHLRSESIAMLVAGEPIPPAEDCDRP